MAEIQRSQLSGEMTQRFIEFIMMQAQQAALFLGRLPNPQSGKPEPNLEIARMFIDQLEMIREKTRGNLTHEESEILGSIISDLQLGYVQASGQPTAAATPQADGATPPDADDTDGKKRFSKSYGS
ncbi:MAG TPA: DUF1844 domain-containing protein [Chthoniobacterales bacterium]